MGDARPDVRTSGDGVKRQNQPPGQQPEPFHTPTGDVGSSAPESDLWVGRTHWKHFMGRLLLWLVALLIAGAITITIARRTTAWSVGTAVWIILALVVISGLPVLGGITLRVLGTRYRLTTQRLFIQRGILSQTVDQTELVRVDDVRVYKPFLDRLWDVGSVGIVSTDATDREIVVEGIAGPDRVAELIRTRMRALRQKSVYLENL
jgi:membrane protein YdbS with pleckstrin-like domain